MDRDLELLTRISALERKVSALYQHLGIAEPQGVEGVSPEVMDAVRSGDAIRAIKLYREQTGASLAEAQQFVQGLVV
jgi:ribosomal protein L7/L12